MAGKGDKPRKKDQKKYRKNWNRIFKKPADKKSPINKQETMGEAK
tara:strand:+ start:12526 stop:12660 length:135 start_codon:yes stop_codon:yes gene_type:complete